MKTAIIITNAYSFLPSVEHQVSRLKEEFSKLGIRIDAIKNGSFELSLKENGEISCGISGDFCVYLDKDKYSSALLERAGMRLFNSHAAIEVCDDKMLTHAALARHGIPMPQTIPAPLCYSPQATVNKDFLDGVERALGYPLIIKQCYGSRGGGVFKADSRAELEKIADGLKCQPHLFQKFERDSAGRDVRVIVIGGKVLGAMKRQSFGDFRSNVELGGKGYPYPVDGEMKELCERVAKILALDYCGIDLLFSDEGYKVCEVNSNAFFSGFESATKINVAKAYAEYINSVIYDR